MTFLKLTLISRNIQRKGKTGEWFSRRGGIVIKTNNSILRSKEEKDKEKAANAALIEEYGFCTMDGHKEKIGNFRYLRKLVILCSRLNFRLLQN